MSDEPIVNAGRDISGQVIVGHHNVAINYYNSVVSEDTVEPPAPRRRPKPSGSVVPRGGAPLGRDLEIEQLEEWIAAGEPVQVSGERGIGKSAVLRGLAARHAENGAVVFLSAAGLTVEDIVQELFQACYDVPDYRPDEERLPRLMARIEALFVIDDFMGDEADLRNLLKAIPAGDLVVASEQRGLFTQGRSLALTGLAEEPALELAVRELGRDPAEEESAALRTMTEVTGGHPLAVIQAAAVVRAQGPEAIELDAGTPELVNVLVAGLASEAREALTVLCALDGISVTAEMAEVLSGDPTIGDGLEQLTGARLAEPGYRLAGGTGQAVAASAHLVPEAGRYAPALTGWLGTASVWEIGDAATIVVGVLRSAVAAGEHAAARDLARTAAPALALSLRWGCWTEVLTLGHRAARSLGATEDVAYFERETNARRKALGKGAAVGTLVGASFAAGHHLAATGGAAAAPAAHGGGLLNIPAVLSTVGALAVAGAIAGGVLLTNTSGSSAPSRDTDRVAAGDPTSSTPTTSRRSNEPPPPTHRTSKDTPTEPTVTDTPPNNDGPPGDRGETSVKCADWANRYQWVTTYDIHSEPTSDGGLSGAKTLKLLWPASEADGCGSSGITESLEVTGQDAEKFTVHKRADECPSPLLAGQTCTVDVTVQLPEWKYTQIYINIPATGIIAGGYYWSVGSTTG